MSIPLYHFDNGVEVPLFGLGLDQVRDLNVAYESLMYAFSIGYRSVDTASAYYNEEAVGKAVRECGLSRSGLYVTTKLTADDQGYEATLKGFDDSLKRMGLDYIDCFLIHWPGKYLYLDTWKAFEKLYEEKLVRVIGVCNFTQRHLEKIFNEAKIKPMVDQIELHPYFQQTELDKYCQSQGLLVEAWSPLMCGGIVLNDPVILGIAEETGRTPAQVVLRWHHQMGHRIFPKSVTPKRIAENIGIFDFSLAKAQLEKIAVLGKKNFRIGPNPNIFFER
jgi:diketogulonate reductase-like aldo/keto reductase